MSVTVYTRTTCPPCRALKHWLKTKGIEFSEKNVDDSPELMDEVIQKSGLQMVPVTLVDDKVISGFNIGAIMSAINNAAFDAPTDPQDALACEGCQ